MFSLAPYKSVTMQSWARALDDGAIVYDEIRSVADFPEGWTDEHEKSRYRLKRRADKALFGYTVGPQSWKRFLFPPMAKT